ncbi:mutS family protein. putative [Ixodes scapularis]|uniref:MutS family protein. putative n=1 Tax=Ixodes scapularis TaxID=6945 RepID=B7PJT6_IXOSC|nr:mutS family protein. putative [Ixodes scapularis]|eukprot:XP_002408552.1 mutS family protein. putative [Ixodes scapularis]
MVHQHTYLSEGVLRADILQAVQPTTGEVLYDSFQESSGGGELEQRLESLQPVEVVLSEKSSPTVLRTVASYQSLSREGVRVEHLSPSQFDLSASLDALTKFYRRDGVESKGELATLMALPPVVVCCIGSLLGYLATFKLEEVLRDVSRFTAMAGECRRMAFTSATLRRLDLFRNSLDGTSRGSLLDVMDHTATAFGRRLLFSWLGQPLADLGVIIERQDAVEDILSSGSTAFSDLRKFLSRMPDVQRGLCAILHKKVKPSDAFEILTSLASVRDLFSSLQNDLTLGTLDVTLRCLDAQAARSNNMAGLFTDLSHWPDLMQRKQDVINTEEKLVALKKTIAGQLGLLTFDYKTVSGMPYLIEVPTRRLSSVPSNWLKISSTKTAERFRSPAVDSLYKELCVGQELVLVESRKTWNAFLGEVSQGYNNYQRAVRAIATVDCFLSLARTASQYGYCRPQMLPKEHRVFRITKGRHPILEQRVTATSQYVCNDTDLSEDLRCCVITGPNMGGKSSYMRQVALIAIMAHVGSHVPAEAATISLLDGVYVRMGAEDDVTLGRSTFLCEMQETSEILDKCTTHSLVVIDELGRGTATHDGTAIALATLRHLVEEKQCLTLFVTHYQPITEMETFYKGAVTNCHVAFNVDDDGKQRSLPDARVFIDK